VVANEPALAGNPQFTVGVSGGAPGAAAVLVIDDAIPSDGPTAPTGSFANVPVVLGTHGEGSATLAIPDEAGRVLYGRWYAGDFRSSAFRFQVFGPHGTVPQAPVAVPGTQVAAHLYAGFPNPFTASTSMRYDLKTPSSVSLAVYDVAGRLQRRLDARAIAVPGSYTVAWDGTDDGGRRVPAGVYFYRLVTAAGVATARVVRIQ
jgi:hypothetical protein